MRIELLDEAQDGLIQGFHFYEGREAGLGAYFLAACSQTLIPSSFTPEFIKSYTVIAVASPSVSHLPSITAWREIMWFVYMPYWIALGTRYGSGNGWREMADQRSSRPPEAAAELGRWA